MLDQCGAAFDPVAIVEIVYPVDHGGYWDHVPPPKSDRWGPGLRVPTLIISPFAKKGHATNIAENIYYLVHGKPIRGERPKKDLTSSTAFEPIS